MKKAAKEEILKEGSKSNTAAKNEDLKTGYLLGEKDELKKAEEKMRQRRRYIL